MTNNKTTGYRVLDDNPTYCPEYEGYIFHSCFEQGGHRTVYEFPNGYGASVINHLWSQGTELAVLEFDNHSYRLNHSYKLNHTTPITDDVVGYIKDKEELAKLLDRIKQLEARA